LFDPYDRFCNVDMGLVDAEILITSSTWHDHGHIGAAPGAWIFSYPGKYSHKGLDIYGMEVKEERGSPTVVFNVRYQDVSLTNFADMGIYKDDIFTNEQLKILQDTNTAFLRSGHEKVLNYCHPKIIIPEHFFPGEFIKEQIPVNNREDFENQNSELEKMIAKLGYPVEEVNDYKYSIDEFGLPETKILKLAKIHPQVKYSDEPEMKRYW
jgi:hypothetical protein